jgi:hypothetical protein
LLATLILGQIAFGWYLQEIPRGTPPRTVYVYLRNGIFRRMWPTRGSP